MQHLTLCTQTDWRQPEHWQCNNNVHPSRHGTYDGVDQHPYETIFVKASWHVGEPFTSTYTRWFEQRARGQDTQGTLNEGLYRWAITPEAESPRDVAACYRQHLPQL